jgi:hypothetical protein
MEEVNNATKRADKERKIPGIPFTGVDDPRRWKEGRPKGTENFSTKWRKFIDKIALIEGSTPDEVEEELLLVARKKAQEGNYKFYKDIWDRVYGQATQNVNVEAKLNIDDEAREKARKALGDI